MTTPVELEQSRAFPVSVERAWQVVLATPLERVFSRRFAAIPPIRGVRDQTGEWGTAGQTRVILLADGGTMTEELTSVVAPEEFRYRIGDVTGPLKALVASVEGRWTFTPAGTGVRVTWAWTVQPLNAFAQSAMPVLGWMWHGYARRGLEQVESLLPADRI
jgi:Polyketide cyclase / dehydrase and lipid transport